MTETLAGVEGVNPGVTPRYWGERRGGGIRGYIPMGVPYTYPTNINIHTLYTPIHWYTIPYHFLPVYAWRELVEDTGTGYGIQFHGSPNSVPTL